MSARTARYVAESEAPRQPSFASQLGTAARVFLVLTLLTGVAYPLAITGVSKVAFPEAAKGSLIVTGGGKVVGSRLLGQPFDDPKYFWGRVSATSPPYDARSSAGSNLGPSNPDLTKSAQARIDALRKADPGNTGLVPVDLVTASGSGLDPHVTPAAAEYQVRRVARVRGLDEERVRRLVRAATAPRDLGFLGEPRVNVLLVNRALDDER